MKKARFRRRFLDERRQALRDSIDYFRTANTQQRNRWTCAELLANLGEPFEEHEILDPPSDPPDIVFRNAQFEVKEILDQGRRRHDEYKAKLKQAEAATDPSDLLTHYTPKEIDPVGVGALVQQRINELAAKYDPAFQRTLDLLIYVNLTEHELRRGPMPAVASFAGCGWRSVSAVFGWGGFVFHAEDDAPEFLKRRVGTATEREFE